MHFTPEQKARFNMLADITTAMLGERCASLAATALEAVEFGCGTNQIVALRSKEQPEFASVAVVMSGKYSDADLATIKTFLLGAMQDGNMGAEVKDLSNIDNTTPEGGA